MNVNLYLWIKGSYCDTVVTADNRQAGWQVTNSKHTDSVSSTVKGVSRKIFFQNQKVHISLFNIENVQNFDFKGHILKHSNIIKGAKGKMVFHKT